MCIFFLIIHSNSYFTFDIVKTKQMPSIHLFNEYFPYMDKIKGFVDDIHDRVTSTLLI